MPASRPPEASASKKPKSCVLKCILYDGETSPGDVLERLCTLSVPLQFLSPLIHSLSLFEVCVSKAVGMQSANPAGQRHGRQKANCLTWMPSIMLPLRQPTVSTDWMLLRRLALIHLVHFFLLLVWS